MPCRSQASAHSTRGLASAFALALVFACAGLRAFAALPEAGAHIIFNPSILHQAVNHIGADIHRATDGIIGSQSPDTVLRWAFADVKFTLCRVKFDKHQELKEGASDFSVYTSTVTAMQLIREVAPNVQFIATQNSEYDGYGDENNFPDWIFNPQSATFKPKAQARFLADYTVFMHTSGVPLSYLSVAKEQVHLIKAPQVVETIRELRRLLQIANVPMPRMVEPGSWSILQGLNVTGDLASMRAAADVAVLATHNYLHHGEASWRDFVRAANALGRPAWNTESVLGGHDLGFYSRPGHGFASGDVPIIRHVTAMAGRFSHYRAGIAGEIFFEITSRGAPGQHLPAGEARPIFFTPGGPPTRTRAYYIMQAWVNSVAGSVHVDGGVAAQQAVDAIAFRRTHGLGAGDVVLWAVNRDSTVAVQHVQVVLWNDNGVDLQYSEGNATVVAWTASGPPQGTRSTVPVNQLVGLTFSLPPLSIVMVQFSIL